MIIMLSAKNNEQHNTDNKTGNTTHAKANINQGKIFLGQ